MEIYIPRVWQPDHAFVVDGVGVGINGSGKVFMGLFDRMMGHADDSDAPSFKEFISIMREEMKRAEMKRAEKKPNPARRTWNGKKRRLCNVCNMRNVHENDKGFQEGQCNKCYT